MIFSNPLYCPRCKRNALQVESVVSEQMPDPDGTRRFEEAGKIYYHFEGIHCVVPKTGESYTMALSSGKVA